MTTRSCCICHASFEIEDAYRNAVTCRTPDCIRARARQRREAFELRRKRRKEEAEASQAQQRARAACRVDHVMPSDPRPVRLPDGTCAYVVWAGDMIVKTGERGGLVGAFC